MRIFKIIGICFLALGGLAVIVLLLLPFGIQQYPGIFQWKPVKALWLLSTLAFTFGAALVALAKLEKISLVSLMKLEKSNKEKLEKSKEPIEPSAKSAERRSLSKAARIGACALLGLGFVAAVELFLLRAFKQIPPKATSLWWLFAISSLLGVVGAIASWATQKSVLIEREEAIKKVARKDEVRAKAQKSKLSLKIYRFTVRPHAACQQKPLLHRRGDRTAYTSRDITTYSWR
jgi:hypothetical protein